MKTVISLASLLVALGTQSSDAAIIGYSSVIGGSYNSVGPFYESPQYIGDKFTVTNSGWLETIQVPLSRDPFYDKPAKGKISIWSDNSGSVGSLLFSAPITTTNPVASSNSLLPPFTIVSVSSVDSIYLTAGVNYWLTFSETDQTNVLNGYSAVYTESLESVYFTQDGMIQYGTGLQAMVATITLNPNSPQFEDPTNIVSISATMLLQTMEKGLPVSARSAINTQKILNWLAKDEFQAGVYSQSNFPAGTRLALIGSGFAVVDKNNNLVADVSNILTGQFGVNEIIDQKETVAGVSQNASKTSRRIFSMNYDDSNISGSVGVNFHFTGLMTITTGTKQVKGVAIAITREQLSSATGEGNLRGVPFIITSGFVASGIGALNGE